MLHVAGDHHAEPLLVRIRQYLTRASEPFNETGYNGGEDPTAKLEEFIPNVVQRVLTEPGSQGILVCGTGAGVEVGANKFSGIRASLCNDPRSASWARTYDNANVLCLASWAIDNLEVEDILEAWLASEFDGSPSRSEMFRIFDSWASQSNPVSDDDTEK